MITGMVQGVVFRYSARREAERLMVTGWARNLDDGGVEIVAEGEKTAVEELVRWCHHGPPGAMVRKVDTSREEYKGEFNSFFIE